VTRELWWIDALGVEYQFNETDLGLIVLDGPLGLDAPPEEPTTAPRPGDGSILTNQRRAARPITLPVLFNGTTHRVAMKALVDSFALGPGQLRHVDDDGTARSLREVIYDGGLEGDDAQARSDWSRRVLNLVALDPYWYDDTDDVALGPPEADTAYDDAVGYDAEIPYDGAAAGISAGVGYDDAIDYDADIPYDGGTIVEFDLASPMGVWPTITVRGPATFVQVVHLGTGETIETLPGVEVPGGRDMLIVNRPEDRTIMLAGAEAWDRVTAGSSASMLVRPGQITDLRDENGVQVRDPNGRIILVQGQADRLSVLVRGTSASSWVRIAWEERWLTP
jgi:hypothetical protein